MTGLTDELNSNAMQLSPNAGFDVFFNSCVGPGATTAPARRLANVPCIPSADSALALGSRRRPVGAKVFFTSVAQPDAQVLWNLILLFLRQFAIERQRAFPFTPTSSVPVGLPIIPRHADAPADLFDEFLAFQGLLALRRHCDGSVSPTI